MLTIYGIKNCDTMKKAFTELETLGAEYVFHDYKKAGIDARTLAGWIKTLGLDTVLNRKGTTWRKLTPDQQATAGSESGAIALMVEQPSLIKRPVLAGDGFLLCGFSAEDYRKHLQG